MIVVRGHRSAGRAVGRLQDVGSYIHIIRSDHVLSKSKSTYKLEANLKSCGIATAK